MGSLLCYNCYSCPNGGERERHNEKANLANNLFLSPIIATPIITFYYYYCYYFP